LEQEGLRPLIPYACTNLALNTDALKLTFFKEICPDQVLAIVIQGYEC